MRASTHFRGPMARRSRSWVFVVKHSRHEATEFASGQHWRVLFRKGTKVPDQFAFFSADQPKPQGLVYQPEFISEEEEQELIGRASALPLSSFQFGAFEGKRRVASFGSRYNHASHSLERADDPAFLDRPAAGQDRVLCELANPQLSSSC